MAALPLLATLEPSPFRPRLDGLVTTRRNCSRFRPPGRQKFGHYLETRPSAPQCAQDGMKRAKYLAKVWFLRFEAGEFPGIGLCCNLNG